MFPGERRYVVKKAIREYQERHDEPVRPGSPEYSDLMANIEGQVQRILRGEA